MRLLSLSRSRLSFCADVMALLDGTNEEPPNNKPAAHVAASKVATKNNFLIIVRLLGKIRMLRKSGVSGNTGTVELCHERVNGEQSRRQLAGGRRVIWHLRFDIYHLAIGKAGGRRQEAA